MALFPPVVASSMPAFAINPERSNNSVKIYFTLSDYNFFQKEDIKNVHVSVRNQASNVNVVPAQKGDILIKNINEQTEEDKILNRYSITILDSDLVEPFNTECLYKVQLRFSKIEKSDKINYKSFFTEYIEYFSEWSTVCIIKPIIAPIFYIDEFHYDASDDYGQKSTAKDNFYYSLAEFTGIFKAGQSSEVLKKWRIRLLKSNFEKTDILNINSFVLADSDWNLISAYNYTLDNNSLVLQTSLLYNFKDHNEKTYKILFQIQTKNGYTDSKIYLFDYKNINIKSSLVPQTAKNSLVVNEEEGYVKVKYVNSNSTSMNLTLRRTDSKSDFLKWEDLKIFQTSSQNTFIYYDFTTESGISYRYGIQERDSRGRRSELYIISTTDGINTVTPEWEHSFLLQQANGTQLKSKDAIYFGFNNTKQLKLKYDFQISSYKTNISENKTDTIGSKYPFIRRNGNMYYRSFSCTGVITSYMDNVELFINRDNLQINKELKQSSGYNQLINKPYDYNYERKFREYVESFLYNNKPKLYKSTQEGNILIKLMDISLTPKTELNRLVYSFSATAYQIGEASLANFIKYDIISLGVFNPQIVWEEPVLGQITSFKSDDEPTGNVFKAGKDIIGTGDNPSQFSIAAKEQYLVIDFTEDIMDDFKIDQIKLTIESDPYLIIEEDGIFRPYKDINSSDSINFTSPIDYQLYQMESTYNNKNIYLGTLFTINGQQIIVSPPNNIYELKENDLGLPCTTTIIPAKDTLMTVDYAIRKHMRKDNSQDAKRINVVSKIGQIYGLYNQKTNLINYINSKYNITYNKQNLDLGLIQKVKETIQSFITMKIDAQPGSVFKIGQAENNYEYFYINETGELTLNFSKDSSNISFFKAVGLNFKIDELQDRTDLEITSTQSIKNVKQKDYCYINNIYYVYYKNQWYKAEPQKDNNGNIINKDGGIGGDYKDIASLNVFCPIEIMLFFAIELKEEYF